MRYVAAYLLASLGGNANPGAADIEKILSSVGIEVDKDRLKKVVAELTGKDLATLIKEGSEKLASVPSGGAAPAAGGAAAAPAAGDDGAKKKEEKVEEEEEEDEDMGFGLFD